MITFNPNQTRGIQKTGINLSGPQLVKISEIEHAQTKTGKPYIKVHLTNDEIATAIQKGSITFNKFISPYDNAPKTVANKERELQQFFFDMVFAANGAGPTKEYADIESMLNDLEVLAKGKTIGVCLFKSPKSGYVEAYEQAMLTKDEMQDSDKVDMMVKSCADYVEYLKTKANQAPAGNNLSNLGAAGSSASSMFENNDDSSDDGLPF